MVLYAKVNDVGDEVLRFANDPGLENVSGKPTEQMLLDAGWLPVVRESVSLEPWEKKGSTEQIIEADRVRLVETKEQIPLAEFKEMHKEKLLSSRDSTLLGRFGEMTLILGALGVLSTDEKKAVDDDSKLVYDEVKAKQKLIDDATTYQEVLGVYSGIVAFMDPADVDENGFPIPDEELI